MILYTFHDVPEATPAVVSRRCTDGIRSVQTRTGRRAAHYGGHAEETRYKIHAGMQNNERVDGRFICRKILKMEVDSL